MSAKHVLLIGDHRSLSDSMVDYLLNRKRETCGKMIGRLCEFGGIERSGDPFGPNELSRPYR